MVVEDEFCVMDVLAVAMVVVSGMVFGVVVIWGICEDKLELLLAAVLSTLAKNGEICKLKDFPAERVI